MYEDLSGEKYLNRLYKDLNQSDIVRHTQKGTKNKDEALKKYMDRLETTHSGLQRKADIERLKALYYKKYIIKKEDIYGMLDEEKEIIIREQKISLDKWIDYLTSDDAKYPMWAKYWVFQGMLKIGTYDEASDTYQKRTKKTIAPFIEVNPEIVARCIEIIMEYVQNKNITEESLHALIENGNFQKIYIILTNMKKEKNLSESSKEEGRWITYNYESEEEARKKIARGEKPEYLKLYESLQGHNTGWCTAGSKETAKSQICGGAGYPGGDFQVYYTKDEKGEYKIPRIAIRMAHEHIGEIRGIAKSQNLEEGLEEFVGKKLKEIATVSPEEIAKNLKACEHAKKLTLLNRKAKNKEPFTIEEIKFIWELEEDIEGFGWHPDDRIEEIREKRDRKKDFSINTEIASVAVQQKPFTLQFVSEDIEGYKDIVLAAIKQDGSILEYVPKEKIDKEIALAAVQQDGYALEYVPKEKIDKKVALSAIEQDGHALKYVPKEMIDKKIALSAVQQNYCALVFVPIDIDEYKEIALAAVQQEGFALDYVPKEMIDKEIALAAVQNDGYALVDVPKKMIDKDIALTAVQQNGRALECVPKEKIDKEIALAAVQDDGCALAFVPIDIKEYKEIVLTVVQQDGSALEYVPKELIDKDIALAAVQNDGFALDYVPKEMIDKEIALAAVQNDGYALVDVPKKMIDKDIALAAVQQSGYALKYVPKKMVDKDIALAAVQQKPLILRFVPENIEGYEEIIEMAKNTKKELTKVKEKIKILKK